MADNSPSPRVQPEDKELFSAIISEATRYNFLPTDFNASALYDSYKVTVINGYSF